MEVEGSSKKTIVMQQKEIAEARVPLSYRDQCAHLLIPRNRCRKVVEGVGLGVETIELIKVCCLELTMPLIYIKLLSHGQIQITHLTILLLHRVHGRPMLEIPEDLYHLIKNAVSIRNHLERNKKEKDSKFRLILVDSRIHRLARYYNKTKELPQVWK
ncbi:hypothetical protein JHK82_012342 [Glycine max]|nr:hypothetical protein JHK85_012700 [Glycine max]KAG5057364.1 hypothetical protein JHK86_012360 [Glycine max]KAG5154373.1 hypothetical protein JHK82_012342 [Glycine max]